MIALTREVSDSIDRCELTHLDRTSVNVEVARRQHRAFAQALGRPGLNILQIPAAHDLPDAVFVQDAAMVFDEVAIIARPGAESRRPETAAVAKALERFRSLRFIDEPGTLDGGDVIRVGRNVYVGQTARTN